MDLSSWNIVNYSLLTIGSFLSLIAAFILLRQGKWRLLSNVLLAFYLLGLGIACCMVFLTTTGLIKSIPWLYRLPSPIYYCMFQAGYLYVVTLLEDRNKLHTWEWLFFLPGLVHFVEMLPFYIQSNSFKLDYLTKNLKNPFGAFFHSEGWLPVYTHNTIRGFIGILCGLGIMYWLIKSYRNQPNISRVYSGLLNWLWLFGTMLLLFASAIFFTFYDGGHWKYPQMQSLIMTFCFSVSLIISTTVLLLFPSYLYGMPRFKAFSAELSEEQSRQGHSDAAIEAEHLMASSTQVESHQSMDAGKQGTELFLLDDQTDPGMAELYERYRAQLETYMTEKKPYLQHNYKVSDLARELHIPQHHLTIVLNKVMKMRFNDYVNQYRIRHVQLLIAEHGLTHSLEGLASLAGFSNRVTFTRAVQRMSGQSPSQYFGTNKANLPTTSYKIS
jgi:AraC-like DNA-binding protein